MHVGFGLEPKNADLTVRDGSQTCTVYKEENQKNKIQGIGKDSAVICGESERMWYKRSEGKRKNLLGQTATEQEVRGKSYRKADEIRPTAKG